jgi:hypothetical protein
MVLFAFSIQDHVEKYGAYVGLAAFLGLAVLTVLYFAQARELKRLRDWAGRAPERALELEARVVAPAEAASDGGEETAAVEAAPAPATDGGPPPDETQVHDTAGEAAAPPDEQPAPASGNGTGDHPVIPRATPRPQPKPAAAPLRAAPIAARTAPAAPRRHRRPSFGGSSNTARITALTVTGVVVLAAIVFAITQLFGGGGSEKPAPNVTQPPQSSTKTGGSSGPTVVETRPDTVVAILNGTPTEGLASGARDKLISKGYSDTDGMIRTGNNTDQQRQDSAVYFAPGKRSQARDVAAILGITVSPQAVDPDTLALANATGTGGKSADVVAVLGLDQSP